MKQDPASIGAVEGHASSGPEEHVVAAICSGNEDAWIDLVRRYGAAMLRTAQLYVPDRTIAEEIVQETWLAALTAIGRFEGRSSLKTWLFRILMNKAQRRATAERRSVPVSALVGAEVTGVESSVDPSRFRRAGERWTDHWSSAPVRWTDDPEERLLATETIDVIERAVESLPAAQRAVVTLRDVSGWDASEVCEVLGITAANQRVLLHRARTKVRKRLEEHFASG